MPEALYRKYRPQSFKDVLGQDHVIKVLEAEAKSHEVSHAYLFCGTRGTGKTSIARIFAKEIGTSVNDIYEIDAASHNSVDDIRFLNESVETLPYDSKYKVYILDEVHMLSKSASNAFLKTLEEPPAHVVFILATTEMHKIPETILSRCEYFAFKKPSVETLKQVVKKVSKSEGYEINDESSELVALLGDGSFRDTLGTLQKVINFSTNKVIDESEVRLVTGAPKVELIEDILFGIVDKDLNKALQAVSQANKQNIDMSVFLKLVLHHARAVLLLSFASKEGEKMIEGEFSDLQIESIKKLAAKKVLSPEILIELLFAYERTQGSHIQSLPLELALVKVIGE